MKSSSNIKPEKKTELKPELKKDNKIVATFASNQEMKISSFYHVDMQKPAELAVQKSWLQTIQILCVQLAGNQ